MIRPIHPGLSPNVEKEDFLLALSKIIRFWQYHTGNETRELERWFETHYQTSAYAFASGRGALCIALKSLGLKKGDEVLVVGFTCVAVVDAIIAVGGMPVYVDITKSFVMDISDIKKKVTKRSKVLLLQHTFGISSATKEIVDFAKKQNLYLVEDVAHGVGLDEKGMLLGTFGDVSIFSFGRDKAFSCVSGGMVITKEKVLAKKIHALQIEQKNASSLWVFQNLFHVVSFYAYILPLYDFFSFGKVLLVFFQKIGLLSKPIDKEELVHFSVYTAALPPALSFIALSQLKRLDKFNNARKNHVALYKKALAPHFPNSVATDASLLRFPLLVESPDELKLYARKQQIYLGNWYSNIIDPKGTDISKLFYKKGSCPTAEYVTQHIINLPTYPTLTQKDVEKVATMVLDYAKNTGNNK